MDWLKQITKDHKEHVAIAKKLGAGSFAEDIVQEMYLRLINHANLQKLLKDGIVNKIYIYWAIRNTYLLHKEKHKINTEDINLVYKDEMEKEARAEDIFSNEEDALDKAKEIGCVGTHSMDKNGKTIFMPCRTHDAYEEAISKGYGNDEEDEDKYSSSYKKPKKKNQ